MAAILCSLDLDHHLPGLLVQAEQVDTAIALFPVAKLLGDEHHVVTDDRDVRLQQKLQVLPLQKPPSVNEDCLTGSSLSFVTLYKGMAGLPSSLPHRRHNLVEQEVRQPLGLHDLVVGH